jgi:excisionase family DNA binding protein
MDDLIKLQDAAKRLGISRSRLYTLATSGKVPCVRIGGQGRLMFRSADLDEQLKPRQSQPTPTPGVVETLYAEADIDAEPTDAQPTLDFGITPEEMEVMLRAAFKALIEVRAKAEMQRPGITTNPETAKDGK